MKRALMLVMVSLAFSTEADAQYCPNNPPPREPDKRPNKRDEPPGGGGGQCMGGGGSPDGPPGGGGPAPLGGGASPPDWKMGDPVVMAGDSAYTFDRLEDLFIPMPTGEGFSFHRTYYSKDDPWTSDNSGIDYTGATNLLTGVACPYGASRTMPGPTSAHGRSLRWTHSLFSMVDQTANNSVWVVRPPTGNHEEFGRCESAPCWAPQFSFYAGGQTERLLRTSAGFEFQQEDHKKYVYEASTSDAGQFYLTGIVGTNGQAIATVSYRLPFEGCSALSAEGVPYVYQVILSGGQVLTFHYSDLEGDCVLSQIKMGDTLLVEYTYDNDEPGLLSRAQTQEHTEDFEYEGGFSVSRNGTVLVSHAQASSTVTSSYDRNGSFTYSSLGDLSLGATNVTEAQDPCGASVMPLVRTATDTVARVGDGDDEAAGLEQAFTFNTGYNVTTHTANLWSRTDSCTVPYSCSPGQVRWVYRGASTSGGYSNIDGCGGTSNPGVPYGTKDKRDNWVLTPQSRTTFVGGEKAFEVRAIWKGVPSYYDGGLHLDGGLRAYPNPGTAGANALETTDYTYTYSAGAQAVATETRPSAITAGVALTTYRRDSANRVIARFQSGSTMLLDGTLAERVIATFYGYTNGLLMSESGPCEVDDTEETECAGGSPLTEYAYYSLGGLNGGRLHTVSRYASTETLVTTYGEYTELGEPGFVTDENGVTTEFAYEGHNVTRVTRMDGVEVEAEWLYDWDNEQLVSVRFPEGNYEAYCYRASATPTGGCSGDWTGQLQMVSKASAANGVTGWTEAIVYEHWGDGTLRTETRYTNVSSSAVARYHQAYAADAHRRPTRTVTGATGTFAEARAFDGANNREAVGPAYNQPPAFCRSAGSPDATAGALSRLCAQMGFDGANRLRQLDLFADASSSTRSRACIDYDKRGNVSRVTTGCGGGDTCSMGAGQSTCSGGVEWGHDYLTDDFGNVVQVKLSGADNGDDARGIFRFEFDARGNVVKQQTEDQRRATPVRYVAHEYERLGRRSKTKEYVDGTPSTVLTWAYDDDTGELDDPPVLCGGSPVATLGRLRAVRDPVFTRWYEYDGAGRVTKEVRRMNGMESDFCLNMQLRLTYSANGNLTSMRHGFGRIVTYGYGSGGLTDRIDNVSFSYFHDDTSVEARELVSNVTWEPYGGLRKYRIEPEEVWVDYEKGAATSEPGSRCPSGALGETVDQTQRLRSLRVYGGREVYRRTYTWRADQVEQIDSCYLGGGEGGAEYLSEVYEAGEGLGYDGLERLKGGVSPTFATMGGPWAERKYEYDVNSNITRFTADGTNYDYTLASGNKRDWVTSLGADSWNKLDFEHDPDGRIVSMAGPVDSSGLAAKSTLSYVGISPGSDTVMRGVTVTTGNGSNVGYNYYYDSAGRRVGTSGPTDFSFYLYDLGHQLLETATDRYLDLMVEDFIWLDGRPIAAIRSLLQEEDTEEEQLAHLMGDEVGSCSRGDDGVPCGIYFIVTDHIGKPVLAMDYAGRITGVGEYEPRGLINRVQMVEQTPHPYEKTSAATTFYTMEQKALGRLEVRFRAHFPMVDTEEDCSGVVQEGIGVWSADEATLHETIGGYAKGDVWTQWWAGDVVSDQRVLKLGWGRGAGNCVPAAEDPLCAEACPQHSGDGWAYSGFVLREYEYARNESGASPYFPNLRFPGHYWDAETDLHENWHRYYSPLLGQYLSPEPLLQSSRWALERATDGQMTPTFAYARNNPARYQDDTGLSDYDRTDCASRCARVCTDNAFHCKDVSPFSQCLAQAGRHCKGCYDDCRAASLPSKAPSSSSPKCESVEAPKPLVCRPTDGPVCR